MRFSLLADMAALASSALAAQWSTFVDRTGPQSNTAIDLGTNYVEFKSQNLNDTKLRFVKNSGVCETTPGVNQLSGYIDVGTNMSMVRPSSSHRPSHAGMCSGGGLVGNGKVETGEQWFWFFEARHEPEIAPFTLWCVSSFFPLIVRASSSRVLRER